MLSSQAAVERQSCRIQRTNSSLRVPAHPMRAHHPGTSPLREKSGSRGADARSEKSVRFQEVRPSYGRPREETRVYQPPVAEPWSPPGYEQPGERMPASSLQLSSQQQRNRENMNLVKHMFLHENSHFPSLVLANVSNASKSPAAEYRFE